MSGDLGSLQSGVQSHAHRISGAGNVPQMFACVKCLRLAFPRRVTAAPRTPGATALQAIAMRRAIKHLLTEITENSMRNPLSRSVLFIGAAVAALGLAPLASAQDEKLADLMGTDAPKAAPAKAKADAPDPEAGERARLNAEQAAAARAQLEANAASRQAYDAAVREHAEIVQAQEAAAAKAAADHAAAMARWEETVKACKRGDRARCEAGY